MAFEDVAYEFHILQSGLVSPACVNILRKGCAIGMLSFLQRFNTTDRITWATELTSCGVSFAGDLHA